MTVPDEQSPRWEDMIIADRMMVDRDFQSRVDASSFTNQGWELVMTAVQFEIVDAEDPENAYIDANLEHLESVIPAIKEANAMMKHPQGSKTFMEKVSGELRGLFGGNRRDADRRAEAERLTAEYAQALSNHLKRQDKWETVCEAAAA